MTRTTARKVLWRWTGICGALALIAAWVDSGIYRTSFEGGSRLHDSEVWSAKSALHFGWKELVYSNRIIGTFMLSSGFYREKTSPEHQWGKIFPAPAMGKNGNDRSVGHGRVVEVHLGTISYNPPPDYALYLMLPYWLLLLAWGVLWFAGDRLLRRWAGRMELEKTTEVES